MTDNVNEENEVSSKEINAFIESLSINEREADYSLMGYFYQLDLTLHRILIDNSDKSYQLEKIEDYVSVSLNQVGASIKAVQIKYHINKVTNSTIYKPLFYGYISFLKYLKISPKNINFELELLIGSDSQVEVDKTIALDNILECIPFDEKYKSFKSMWEKYFTGENPKLIDNECLRRQYLKKLQITEGYSYDKLNNEIFEIIENTHNVPKPRIKNYYSLYWNTIREFCENLSKKEFNKSELRSIIESGIDANPLIEDKDFFESEQYNEYTKYNIISLLSHYIEENKSRIKDYLQYDPDLETIASKYLNDIYPLINKVLLDNFNTRLGRQSFLNALTGEKIVFNNKLNNEIELFRENKENIKSYLVRLAKLLIHLDIDTLEMAKRMIDIEGIWKLIEVDERGDALLMAGLIDSSEALHYRKAVLGEIVKKHIEMDEYFDVIYLDQIGIKCDKICPYEIDLEHPESSYDSLPQDNISNYYRVECLSCLDPNDIQNFIDCKYLIKKECKND
ncbi:MAG: hypothetical protein ACQEQF_10020 [Bacillota bacterium]